MDGSSSPQLHNSNVNANLPVSVHTTTYTDAVPIYTHRQKSKEEDKPEDYGKDWRRLAEIFDRLFFWLFLLAILISTLVLFHPLTKSYMQEEGIV